MDKYIEIEGTKFYGFSWKYVVGFSLITYEFEGTLEHMYCCGAIDKTTIVNVVRYRNEGLEHLIGKIMLWSANAMTIIIPNN